MLYIEIIAIGNCVVIVVHVFVYSPSNCLLFYQKIVYTLTGLVVE